MCVRERDVLNSNVTLLIEKTLFRRKIMNEKRQLLPYHYTQLHVKRQKYP